MKKSYIDWENRKIIGKSGRIYNISPETITAGRSAEFEIRSYLLPYRTDFESQFKLNTKIINTIKNIEIGKIKVSILYELLNELEAQQIGLLKFQEAKRSAVIEFCALFCNYEGEETGNFNEDIIREKFNDWNEIPEQDFFLLSANSIKYFRESLMEIQQKTKADQTEHIVNIQE